MRRMLVTISLTALLAVTGSASAVTVDFSGIDPAYDITLPNTYIFEAVALSYDNFGKGGDSAVVAPNGITGTTGGVLIVDFSAPTTQLNLDFSLLGVSGSVSDGLLAIFKNGGNDVGDAEAAAIYVPLDPGHPEAGGRALGSLAYQGAAFDQVFIYFSTDAPRFSAANLSCSSPAALLRGDITGDGHVNMFDLLVFAQAWDSYVGEGDDTYNPACDLDNDGQIDVIDLLILAENFGK